MSWVKARAYSSPQFVLNRLLVQVEADLEDANQLPEDVRSGVTFTVRRKPNGATVEIAFNDSESVEVVRFGTAQGSHVIAIGITQGHTTRSNITARWDMESGSEQWFFDDQESPRTISEVTQAVLEPFLFAP